LGRGKGENGARVGRREWGEGPERTGNYALLVKGCGEEEKRIQRREKSKRGGKKEKVYRFPWGGGREVKENWRPGRRESWYPLGRRSERKGAVTRRKNYN